MKVKIDIDTLTFVRFWLVVIGFALAALLIYSAKSALIIICAALFFAIAMSPWVNRLAKIFPSKSRILGTTLAYLVVVAVLGVIVFLVIPPVAKQSAKFVQTIPGLIDSATDQYNGINDFVKSYGLEAEFDKVVSSTKDSATEFASNVGPQIIKSIGSVLTAIASVILVLVLAFLMLIEAPNWMKLAWSAYKDEGRKNRHSEILKKMYSVLNGYITGQFTVATIAGLFGAALIFILSLFFDIPVDLAIPAAVVVFVTTLIPIFGSTIGAVIISMFLILNSLTATLIFLALFVIYQQIESNFIVPKIQSNKLDLSALTILVSLTIGIFIFGIIGGIISIPIAGCIKVIIDDYFKRSDKKISAN
jgi:predicted PurR-regulated permease PerM